MKGWIGMRRDKLSNIFLWIMFIITFPFLFVYVAGTELFKKAIYVIAVIFAGWFGLFLFTTGLIAVLGDWKNALNQAVDLAINIKGAILIEIPQKMPIWTKEVVNYLYAHPFVRNLLIMWLIGFLISRMNLHRKLIRRTALQKPALMHTFLKAGRKGARTFSIR
jgi:hypothetical protein